MTDEQIIKLIKKVGILLILAFLLLGTFRFVKAGTVQVVTRFGRVTGRILHPGANMVIPLVDSTMTYNTKKVTYETSAQPDQSNATYTDFSVDTTTQDGQQVKINYTVRFSVDPTKAGWVANNIGTEDDLVEKVVKMDSRIHVRNTARQFDAADLYTGNIAGVQKAVEEVLRPIFDSNGLLLDEFGIRSIAFGQEYIDTIEAKQIEQEKVTTEENIAKQEEFRKQARITKAEGQAKEQELQRATLTDELLRKMWIERWNGILPEIVAGDSGLLLEVQ